MKYYLSNHLMESDFGKLYFKINAFLKSYFICKDDVTFNPGDGGTADFEPLKCLTHLVLRAALHGNCSIPNQADGEVEHRTDIFECPHQNGRSRPPTHPAMGLHTLCLLSEPKAHLSIAQFGRKI